MEADGISSIGVSFLAGVFLRALAGQNGWGKEVRWVVSPSFSHPGL